MDIPAPIRAENLCKTYQTRQRKGIFKSQKALTQVGALRMASTILHIYSYWSH